ncbi:hypothetical protein F5J12DRAFT_784545 [Pisolithus orientalis]|uniref:uncharacterized protein n=1 Tax=Pisolithus orientalis TaxID=936130 RepID=UPI002223F635|nr:uncharacterized protein F5J12DRAFT_784545 [Pisolithus orientalis]KAI5999767.1 hypothetical protein F5J12DRAFT_784545 [Pisolithus orientalis]
MAPQQNHQNVLMSDQHRLSERLHLLYHFGYSDIDMRYQDVDHLSNRHRLKWYDTKSTIHILDTIAVALTTGRPGDVFAAAFDTRGGVTLVLAKDDSPTAEDDRARMVKMDDAVRDFSHGLEEVSRHYTPVSSIDLSTLGDHQLKLLRKRRLAVQDPRVVGCHIADGELRNLLSTLGVGPVRASSGTLIQSLQSSPRLSPQRSWVLPNSAVTYQKICPTRGT